MKRELNVDHECLDAKTLCRLGQVLVLSNEEKQERKKTPF